MKSGTQESCTLDAGVRLVSVFNMPVIPELSTSHSATEIMAIKTNIFK